MNCTQIIEKCQKIGDADVWYHEHDRFPVKGGSPVPEATVVIPLFDKGPWIARAISSVLRQTVRDFVVIVVDDGSRDDGPERVAAFTDARIRQIRRIHAGASAARNAGVRSAPSPFIAFLDADDEWEPDHLESLLRLHERRPEAGLCATACRFIRRDGASQLPTYSGFPEAPWEGIIPDYFRAAAMGKPPVCSSAAGIPANVLLETGLFREGVELGEDLDLWGRVALSFPVAFSHSGSALYHKDAGNRTCLRIPREKELPFIETARARLRDGTVPEHLIPSLRAYCCKLLYLTCRALIRSGLPQRAARLLADSGFKNDDNGHVRRIRIALRGRGTAP